MSFQIFCLTMDRLTGLDSRMGYERPVSGNRAYFSSLEFAKEAAEKDFGSAIK